jgi:uncharacterized protein YgbK (DUF1537 family)
MADLLYSWYGDDFTGSTDVLESLAEGGVRAVLFLKPPMPEMVSRFDGVRAVGLAGDSRSQTPEWMDGHLPDAFTGLRALGAPVLHYKTCSTFDSSPHTGSIGRAMEIGLKLTGGFAPVVVGAPHLRRYVVFGNLFAAFGDEVYRIDRHPSMSRHPVTPMHEADLQKHLALQTDLPSALIPLTDLTEAALERALIGGAKAVVFDGADIDTQLKTGQILWGRKDLGLCVGSSGVTRALLAAWQARGLAIAPESLPQARPVDRLLVCSGSCSPMTATQIDVALANGFTGVTVDVSAIMAGDTAETDRIRQQASEYLEAGRSTVIYSAQGPLSANVEASGAVLGASLGRIVRDVVARTGVRRVLFAGGDTSSHAVAQLGIDALTYAAPTQRGVPLCRVHSRDPQFDGLELALKGGQMGSADFFARVRNGQ